MIDNTKSITLKIRPAFVFLALLLLTLRTIPIISNTHPDIAI